MRSKLVKILIAVFAVCMIAPAFSAVENVKVGGDIAIWGVLRGDLQTTPDKLYTGFSQARVYVSADLSENVQTMVRLINERVWDSTTLNFGIDLDLAYIKVSDFLTPGLSLTIGRQEIELGEGLVVGSIYNVSNYLWLSTLTDLGLRKAFDAVRIDYGTEGLPVNLTAFYSRINEGGTVSDEKLFGVDLGFGLADIAKGDIYYVGNIEKPATPKNINIHTAGLRTVIGIPGISGLSLKAEYAKQFKDSKGWALLAG
ncbi:MAG: alginate export family protein, partial [Candidatus Omnitrophica bacterium]|nr:alginate export family protein [Candidatus Omnitrophota bacterium]